MSILQHRGDSVPEPALVTRVTFWCNKPVTSQRSVMFSVQEVKMPHVLRWLNVMLPDIHEKIRGNVGGQCPDSTDTGDSYDRKSDPQDRTDWSTDHMLCKTYCVIVSRTVLIKYK